jgi:hypothetical protein
MNTYHYVLPHNLSSRQEIIGAIAEVMHFPHWFGFNLDALYDSLTDLSWLPEGEHVLTWAGGDADVAQVFADAQQHTRTQPDGLGRRLFTVRQRPIAHNVNQER